MDAQKKGELGLNYKSCFLNKYNLFERLLQHNRD